LYNDMFKAAISGEGVLWSFLVRERVMYVATVFPDERAQVQLGGDGI